MRIANAATRLGEIFDKYKDGQDICVCFQSGIYELDAAVILRNKGNIKFTGIGKGSKIIVKNTEAALAFVNCKDILIRDLSVVSLFSGHEGADDKKFILHNLNGAVTIEACENILLENLTLTCANMTKYDRREATCLTVKGLTSKGIRGEKILAKPTTVSVINSWFNMGLMQTGVLIVNAAKSHIEGNQFMGNTLIDPRRSTRRAIANQLL